MHSGPDENAPDRKASAKRARISEVLKADLEQACTGLAAECLKTHREIAERIEKAQRELSEEVAAVFKGQGEKWLKASAAVPAGPTPPLPSREELERIRAADWEQACKGLGDDCRRALREHKSRYGVTEETDLRTG